MGHQNSFTKYEREIQHGFRQKMKQAETCDDAKHLFSQTVEGLLVQLFGDEIRVGMEDVKLVPDEAPFYRVSEHLMGIEGFRQAWEGSDLSNVIARLAESAAHHCTHKRRQPWRTTARGRMW